MFFEAAVGPLLTLSHRESTLLRDLEDDSPDLRAQAAAPLRELGPKAPFVKTLERVDEMATVVSWRPTR